MKLSHCRGQDIKVFDIHKYDGLEMSDEFKYLASSVEGQQMIIQCCNGVGSDVGWFGELTYHLIPNTIWFLDVTACSDIHDTDYTYPQHFMDKESALIYKAQADLRLYNNLCTYIKINTASSFLLAMRLRRAKLYYDAVSNCGEDSFLEGKTFDS